jgi:small-conductance mechanosensitive channel
MSLNQVLFELGGHEVTAGRFAIALLVWIAFGVLAFVGAARMSRRLLWPGTAGGNTVLLLLHGFRVKIIAAGLLVALAIMGVRVLPLVGVILALGLISALSFRTTLEQIWAGLLILWERPFSLGERILVGEYEGEVERVGLRATTLRSEERMAIHVPNSYLTRHAIHNRSKTEGGFGLRIPVEVMAHCDSGEVISALRKAAERNNRVRSSPSPKAFMMGFSPRGNLFELRAWVDAYSDGLWARNELCRAIQSEFQRAGLQLVSERSTVRGAAVAVRMRPRRPERESDSGRGRGEGDSGRAREREGDSGRVREREVDSSRTRERDADAGRARERNIDAPREARPDRPRSERSSGRERRPPRETDSGSRRRGGRRAPEPMAASVSEELFSEAEPAPAPLPDPEPLPQPMPEPESSGEIFPAEPTLPEEPAREEYSAALEPESYMPQTEAPSLNESSPAETPAAEGAPPSFGRSKRRVPRR